MGYGNPREWCNTLMDYGEMIKHKHPNPSRKSIHHTVQSKFKGSNREVRGSVIKFLTEIDGGVVKNTLFVELPFERARIEQSFEGLVKEGMIEGVRVRYGLI